MAKVCRRDGKTIVKLPRPDRFSEAVYSGVTENYENF